MEAGIPFLEKLILKLKSGDARSIHLNALPGRYARLDVYDFINISPSLHLEFIKKLLSKEGFKFTIKIDPAITSLKGKEEREGTRRVITKLNHLFYQDQDEFLEHGTRSFAFGYPLLIKKDPSNPAKILKAPVLIWYMELVRSTNQSQTWVLQRNEENPVIFNEVLKAHLESIERIKTDDIVELVDACIDSEASLQKICQLLLEKLNATPSETDLFVKVMPCSSKEGIEQQTKEKPWIRWSGVFGLFKTQKQPIIQDLQNLINLKLEGKEAEDIDEKKGIKGDIITPVAVDPSQEAVLHALPEFERIIIQGPPGTGKSQSLTAIIATALLHKKKILVVCEKRTAMEVLQNNLAKLNLEHLVALVEDVYSDRNAIVQRVRQWIDEPQAENNSFRKYEYEQLHAQYLSAREELNSHLNAIHGLVLGDDSWPELLEKHFRTQERLKGIRINVKNPDGLVYDFHSLVYYLDLIRRANHHLFKTDSTRHLEKNLELNEWLAINDFEIWFQRISILQQNSLQLKELIEKASTQFGNDFTQNKGIKKVFSKIASVFSQHSKDLLAQQNATFELYQNIFKNKEAIQLASVQLVSTEISPVIADWQDGLRQLEKAISEIALLDKEDAHALVEWIQFREKNEAGFKEIFNALASINTEQRLYAFEEWYYRGAIESYALANGLNSDLKNQLEQLSQIEKQLKERITGKIQYEWQKAKAELLQKRDLSTLRMLYNLRKNKQFSSRNSLRQLLMQDFDFFTTVFPVLMANPSVASSIVPLQPGLFDLIILDEASQLRVEDTYAALYRADSHIISGDRHQMPPPSYFSNDIIFWDDEIDNEEIEPDKDSFLAESQSLLEFADDSLYQSTYLDFHYRSQHPDLIAFSNAGFYGSRLVPMPEVTQYKAMHFNAINGTYAQGVNIAEAKAIVNFLYEFAASRDVLPSIGVGTFNIHQRDLVQDLLWETAQTDGEKARLLEKMQEAGLFVKNLENIQGDERDVMVIGTTFGADEQGKFRQAFGPVNQEKGYRLLNVLITRAKQQIHVFTSIPEVHYQFFEDGLKAQGNTGKAIFYAYLSFVRAVSEGNEARKEYILNHLRENQKTSEKRVVSTSPTPPFIDNSIQNTFESVLKEDVQLGGFVLKKVLTKDQSNFLEIVQEQKAVHPNVAYRYKLFRQEMLEKYGIQSYPIASYLWWKDLQKEIGDLEKAYKTE